ncbi:hypothetical protein GCM10027075_27790 [Streptomyces heilongjiangensis]
MGGTFLRGTRQNVMRAAAQATWVGIMRIDGCALRFGLLTRFEHGCHRGIYAVMWATWDVPRYVTPRTLPTGGPRRCRGGGVAITWHGVSRAGGEGRPGAVPAAVLHLRNG